VTQTLCAVHPPLLLGHEFISFGLNLVEITQDAVHVDNFGELFRILVIFVASLIFVMSGVMLFFRFQVDPLHDAFFLESFLMLFRKLFFETCILNEGETILEGVVCRKKQVCQDRRIFLFV
jgi:hypothetical protein